MGPRDYVSREKKPQASCASVSPDFVSCSCSIQSKGLSLVLRVELLGDNLLLCGLPCRQAYSSNPITRPPKVPLDSSSASLSPGSYGTYPSWISSSWPLNMARPFCTSNTFEWLFFLVYELIIFLGNSLITSPLTSYLDQILSIHRNRSSAGFSLDIPLIMLVASILKWDPSNHARIFYAASTTLNMNTITDSYC